ncbi:hypothetical protein BB561_002512 [Smittium simulii]|uniref:FAS1 domain-containing protein n=1 Tax=Smittium simulii TaxID=133385 RepID=A0A2T9YQ70_9FUNG|nr:hypothetical protein BB561_002512 [Smittium simulii]
MNTILNKSLFLLASSVCLVSAAANKTGNIVLDSIAGQKNLSILGSLLNNTAFSDITASQNFITVPFTFLAPSDEAFKNAGDLGTDFGFLRQLLAYHVLNQTVRASEIENKVNFYGTFMSDSEYVLLGGDEAQVLGLYKTKNGTRVIDGTYIEGQSTPKVIKTDIPAAMNTILNKSLFLLASSVCLVSAAANKTGNIVLDSIAGQKNLSILGSLLNNTAFSDITASQNFITVPFTFLAPSDEAFKNAGDLGTDFGFLRQLLAYHVLNQTVRASEIENKVNFYGTFMSDSEYVLLGGDEAQVLGLYKTKNGTRVIDGTYIEGQSTPKVIKTDIPAGNGIIHIIDKVLTIPEKMSTILKNNTKFSTLSALLNKSNILPQLDDVKDITLFAASDAAFSSINSTINSTSSLNLTYILNSGVVPNNVLYSNLINNSTLYDTLSDGVVLDVQKQSNGLIRVNDSFVDFPNVLSKNGIIHGVNKVILPPSLGANRPIPSPPVLILTSITTLKSAESVSTSTDDTVSSASESKNPILTTSLTTIKSTQTTTTTESNSITRVITTVVSEISSVIKTVSETDTTSESSSISSAVAIPTIGSISLPTAAIPTIGSISLPTAAIPTIGSISLPAVSIPAAVSNISSAVAIPIIGSISIPAISIPAISIPAAVSSISSAVAIPTAIAKPNISTILSTVTIGI